MSDVQITTPDPAAPVTDAPSGSDVAQAVVDYQARYQEEKDGRIRERNLYRPAKQLLDGLDADQQNAMLSIAEMARTGDTDGIVAWALDTATNLSGGDLAAAIAKRQAAGTQQAAAPATQQPAAGLDPDTVARMINDTLTQRENVAQGKAFVSAELAKGGFDLDSAHGATIVRYCQQNGLPPADGVAWYKGELGRLMQSQQAAAPGAAAAVALAQAAPTGAPAGGAPAENMGRADRIKEHLRSMNA